MYHLHSIFKCWKRQYGDITVCSKLLQLYLLSICRRTFSRALKVSARNGWFPNTAQQHGLYLHTLFAIHQLFKVQVLHVFIQAKIRRLHESMRDYCRIQSTSRADIVSQHIFTKKSDTRIAKENKTILKLFTCRFKNKVICNSKIKRRGTN